MVMVSYARNFVQSWPINSKEVVQCNTFGEESTLLTLLLILGTRK